MNIQSIISNNLIRDANDVWRLEEHEKFDYTDGVASEQYLRRVFNEAHDLSTQSHELEKYIKDWPSEYHLSIKRAQLLSGFNFDKTCKVLEVGGGCGAITRFLGENFDDVVSIEGNINRAQLARCRTKELDSVSIVCAPFQKIRFTKKFDIIFCIGVFEYSAAFVRGPNPYDSVLAYFSEMLTPNGMVVLAIENQFGLKYLNGAREDHLGVRYKGIEGYHQSPKKARTFGKVELEQRLKTHFPYVTFYYPYPDYKIPDCVIASEFLASERAGELVSQIPSCDYFGPMSSLWSEPASILELAKNGMLEFFSNSFLVIAGRSDLSRVDFNQLAIMFSSNRRPNFSTKSRITKTEDNRIFISKRPNHPSVAKSSSPVKLVECDSIWIDTHSIHTQLSLKLFSSTATLDDVFEPCKIWLEKLISDSKSHGEISYVNGSHIDSIWSNSYIVGDECRIVDREWIWHDNIPVNVVVIRAIYDFLSKLDNTNSNQQILSVRSGKSLIRNIANNFGVTLLDRDFTDFIHIELELSSSVLNVNKTRQSKYLRWFLFDRPTLKTFRNVRRQTLKLYSKTCVRFSTILNRISGR